VQIVVTLVVLVGANGGVALLARNSVPRQLLRHCALAEPATDLFLGNSTMAAGFDEAEFTAASPDRRGVNAALGATSPVEHYLIYSRQVRHRGATIHYGFLDTQLTDPTSGDWGTLVGNRAMAYYVDPETAIRFYAPDDPVRAWEMRLVRRVPAFVERQTIWAKVERVRRTLSEVGLPKKDTNRFGRAEDFALLEPTDPTEFAQRCRRVVDDRVPLNGAVAAILQLAAEQGVRAVVIEMPMTQEHRRRFYSTPEWAAYRQYVTALIHDAGGVYLDASDWVGTEGFADHLHLNADGAKVFTRRIAAWSRFRR